jgi:YidC/Oxa1 family membrane protein insertase
LQPIVKEIQAKYASNPEVMNQKVAEVYQTNEVNPLAGCVPSIVQIPVFIGLYRSVLDLAKENRLDESFLFLPNLEGPTYGADPAQGTDWLLKWVDGVPSLGWDDTSAFLILPVLLVLSQFASMQLMQPAREKGAPEPEGNFVLKLLPLMIGWFSLNVPAALCLYWITNNVVTTASSLLIRNTMKMEPVVASSSSTTEKTPAPAQIFSPMREKPAGFSTPSPVDGVKTITAIDAEIVDNEQVGEETGEAQKAKVPVR